MINENNEAYKEIKRRLILFEILEPENRQLKSDLVGQQQLIYSLERQIQKYEEALVKIGHYDYHGNLIGADARVMKRIAEQALEPGETIP